MISVCMATYNGEKFIREQIESILHQISEDDELIISDDGSTDKTISIIQGFNDSRITIYLNDNVHGFTPNFENALTKAKGDYIFLSDQDDIWASNKVKKILEELKNYDMVISDCITFNNKGRIIQESRFDFFDIKAGFIQHLIKSRYLGCCIAFNKKVLKSSLPFPKRYDLVEHDIWLVAVAFKYYSVKLLHEPLVWYRRHGNNVSDGGFDKGYSIGNKIYRRLYRLFYLFKVKKY